MTVFIIGPDEEDAIKAALSRARQHALPLAEVIKHSFQKQNVSIAYLKNRAAPPPKKHIEQVMLPMGYRLAVSCEEQPAGFCAHLSLSSPNVDKVPRPEAMDMVLQVLGLSAADQTTWLEEFDPGHFAVNVVAVLPTSHDRKVTHN